MCYYVDIIQAYKYFYIYITDVTGYGVMPGGNPQFQMMNTGQYPMMQQGVPMMQGQGYPPPMFQAQGQVWISILCDYA